MNALQYIERSATRKGEYVAYVNGVQRVRRCGNGWQTYTLGSSAGTFTPLYAATLSAMDARIAKLKGGYRTETHKMKTYHNDETIKAKYLSRVRAHRAADNLVLQPRCENPRPLVGEAGLHDSRAWEI